MTIVYNVKKKLKNNINFAFDINWLLPTWQNGAEDVFYSAGQLLMNWL